MAPLETLWVHPSLGGVRMVTLDDGAGTTVRISSYGATLSSVRTPDRDGRIDDVVLGFDRPDAYLEPGVLQARPCFGSTVGRVANRISNARFRIDGALHRLAANEGGNCLHGGPDGFDRRNWHVARPNGGNGVRFELVSPAGDQGFPGTLNASATFEFVAIGTLAIRYEAETDRPTHVNLAAHPYFNLAGRNSLTIGDHHLRIAADALVPIDGDGLPLPGPLLPVAGTDLDCRTPKRLADLLASRHPQITGHGGLNHCYACRPGDDPALSLDHPGSGRRLDIRTTAPGIQVYTANGFDGSLKDDAGRPFLRHQAIALEAQHFPDSPNRPDYPSTLLRPGELYISETLLRFSLS